uniref:Zinc finger, CCHC-type n=1 Tax=Tanacetum cinerariifolium TaxID=118510 RepID=A0A6L2J282_TANCI|nr:hypothetical protein [Tanacetum cinerariifolium]
MKQFLSSYFSMREAYVIGIRIKRDGKGITITQSYYIEKILKKFKCDDCCPVSTPLDSTIKLMPNTSKAVDQFEYSRAIGCLMYEMTSTRPNIAYAVGNLSRFPSVLEGYFDASWITNSEDDTFTTGWVFLLCEGAISWASKKQTCITDSIMEAEFVALAAAGKEEEWLRNLIYEISLMVRELIKNGVIFMDFVRSQQTLADHLTKGLARDLVHKSAIGMGSKSIEISNDETPNSLIANDGR